MIHELKDIVKQATINQSLGLKSVLATVVHLDGSSYRKPGVRMLISENSKTVGAVSGGCVEKEIILRSNSVFKDGKSKIITYDGRYRLGCEGILYILIEPFLITNDFLLKFKEAQNKREELNIDCYYKKQDEFYGHIGSVVTFKNLKKFQFSNFTVKSEKELLSFQQILNPAFHLIIIGGEHDAVKLCKISANLGWDVSIITSPKEGKEISDFPGAKNLIRENPETITFTNIDNNTAVVVMNHSYIQDLKYVLKLSEHKLKYIGMIGSVAKRERLFNEIIEINPNISDEFLDSIYSPAGLSIGAETPEEISISIISEILSIYKTKKTTSFEEFDKKTLK